MIRSVYLLFVFIFFSGYSAEAQFWFLGQNAKERYQGMPFKPHSSVSFGAGSSNYVGDLVPVAGLISVGAQTMRWNLGLQYTRHLSKYFSGNIQVSYIRIAGDDNYFPTSGVFAGNYYRNLHFRNDVKELSVSAVYEPMGNAENLSKRPLLSPYLYLGVAGFAHNPVARKDPSLAGFSESPSLQSWQDLQTEDIEGAMYSLVNISIPFGFGFRYKLGAQVDLGFDFGYRVSLSDFLDDVSDNRSKVLVSPSIYFNRSGEPFAANTLVNRIPLSTTTTAPLYSTGPDQYFTTQIRLIFHIKNKIDCPPLPN
jgi:hypothetical protein